MRSADDPQATHQQPSSFAELLNHLFATHLSPEGRRFTLRDVCEGTGGKLSIAYLSLLRRGGSVGFPSADKVKALADFFGVSIDYFVGSATNEDGQPGLTESLQQALSNPEVRDIALRASSLDPAERQFFIQMLEQAFRLHEHRNAVQNARTSPTAHDATGDQDASGNPENKAMH